MTYQAIVTKWGTLAKQYAIANGLDWSLVLADIMQESSGNERAISKCGARGLMQIMKGALTDYNQAHKEHYAFDQLFIANVNIRVGCWYLHHLITRCDGNITKGLQSYNQGFGRVRRSPEAGLWYAEGVLKHQVALEKIIKTADSAKSEQV